MNNLITLLFFTSVFFTSCTVNRMGSMGNENQAKLNIADIESEIGFDLDCEKELRRQPVDENLLKEKTLYIVKEHLQKKADYQSIQKVYPYKFRLVSRNKAMEAIDNGDSDVIVLGQDFNRVTRLANSAQGTNSGFDETTPYSYVFLFDTSLNDCVGGITKTAKYPNAGSVTINQIKNIVK